MHVLCLLLWDRAHVSPLCIAGPESLDKDPSYLTSAQAMADYALLIRTLKADLDAEDSPVIAFGGSYGGHVGVFADLPYK